MKSSYLKRIEKITQKHLWDFEYAKGLKELDRMIIPQRFLKHQMYARGIMLDHLAMSNRSKKKYYQKLAKTEYIEALRVDPYYLKGYYGLGRIELHNGNYKKGINYYKEALKINPTSRSAKLSLATAYVWAKKYNEAIKIFNDDVKRYGNSFRVIFNLFQIYKNTNKSKALKYANKSLMLWKNRPVKERVSKGGVYWLKLVQDFISKNAKI